jgi:hypothetical protein
LIGEAGPWQANACVQWSVDQEMQADGYRIAARRLAERAPEWFEQDFLLYPIIFLYRHYVELRLKNLIALGQKLSDEPVNVPEVHDLVKLWAKAKPRLLHEVNTDDDIVREIPHAERVIADLAALDPRGTAFRYATNVHGGRPLPDGLVRLNLHQFASTMDKLGRTLDDISNWLDMCLDHEREMAEEFIP